ncbi:MAG: methyltransferase domain-containing protein [Planctomycetota bacterium]
MTRTCYEIHAEDEMRLFLRTLGREEDALFGEYMQTGFGVYVQIAEILRRLGRRLGDVRSLLDFAAGYGRVVRFLLRDLPPQHITVSDIYTDAVVFQRERFGVHGFVSQADPDTVDLGGPYDLITCVSLFTHLPAPLFGRWLQKLAGALTPDGLLLFTTQAPSLHQEGWRQDYTFVPASESRSLDTAIYGSTFVSRRFVTDIVEARLADRRILITLPQTLNEHQDVYVLGPASDPELTIDAGELTLPSLYLDGLVQEGDQVRFWGWGVSTHDNIPAARIRTHVDDDLVWEGSGPGIERPDLAARLGVSALHCGFEGRFSWQEEMSHGVLAVQAEDRRGLRARIFTRLPF